MQQIKIENEIIKIQNTDKENMLWKWITRIGGVLGVLLTGFVLYQSFFPENPSISAKIIGFSGDVKKTIKYSSFEGKVVQFPAFKYLMRVSINVINEDLNYKDIIVEVTYNNGKTIKAQNFNPNSLIESLKYWNYGGNTWSLHIPMDQIILFRTALEKNKTHIGYVAFFVADKNNGIPAERPKSIRIGFVDSSNKDTLMTNTLTWEKLDEVERMYDKDIWTVSEQYSKSREKEIIATELRKSNVDNKINSLIKSGAKQEFLRYFEGFILYLHSEVLDDCN